MNSLLELLEEEKIVFNNLATAIERRDFHMRAGASKKIIGELCSEVERFENDLKKAREDIKFYISEYILDEEVDVIKRVDSILK